MCYRELLDRAIDACENLKKYFYKIVIGKNGNEVNIDLYFTDKSFFHLLGLHYLKDIFEFNNHPNAEREYSRLVKNKKSLRNKTANSENVTEDVLSRWDALIKLENILDHNMETYYDKRNYYGGRIDNIEFDYAFHLKNNDNSILSFYFIKNENYERYTMVSTFENIEPNRHCGRPFTLIKKTKVNIKNNACIELYNFGDK